MIVPRSSTRRPDSGGCGSGSGSGGPGDGSPPAWRWPGVPAAGGPDTDGAASDGPASDGPAADGPAADGPAADGPAADGPAGEAPAADGPAGEAPAAGHGGRSWVMPGQDPAAGPRTVTGVSERAMSGPGITTGWPASLTASRRSPSALTWSWSSQVPRSLTGAAGQSAASSRCSHSSRGRVANTFASSPAIQVRVFAGRRVPGSPP